ncbi:MAG: aminoglycoside phosphotransferase family protein [Desulfobulbaceae bacterium]|nr:MAG: aminoglycoside phosphotransferase family protein [Desulfobulbaceae bacterium]
MDKSTAVSAYLKDHGWLSRSLQCTFLAAGEYNENYRIVDEQQEYVFRINHGTQLGLSRQIEYEFHVLEAVFPSGVTPRPYRYSLDGGGLGNGVLLMEYIPGRPLDYVKDLDTAARIFARIHRLPTDPRLIVQEDPIRDIAAESLGMLKRCDGREYSEVRNLLLQYYEDILEMAAHSPLMFEGESWCIVNTEVNSGNFLVDSRRSCLVDWEKAVVSCRYQDLAHFLVPTTTLWKTDCRLNKEARGVFLETYRQQLGLDIPLTELHEKTAIMERVILLRALSWCYMAWHEYTSRNRALTNDTTFRKIVSYLDEARCFLS